jgi:hypothetical protein
VIQLDMPDKVKVLIVISGGVLQQISSSTPEALDALVLDYDAVGCVTSVLVSRHSAAVGIVDAEFMRRSLQEALQVLTLDERKADANDTLTSSEVNRAKHILNSFIKGAFE